MKIILYVLLIIIIPINTAFGKIHVVSISQTIPVTLGDTIQTKDKLYSAIVKITKSSDCAVPGFNCGAGYQPARYYLEESCKKDPCENSGSVYYSGEKLVFSLENEQSCLKKKNNKTCFYSLYKRVLIDSDCSKFESTTGKYYCLNKFSQSRLKSNRELCDKLPSGTYALKWNCFYEWAIRYKDPLFCEKYSASQLSGRNRCFLKMANLLKSKAMCKKIIKSKDDSYLEQCFDLNLKK